MASQGHLFPTTYERYLASKYALRLHRGYADADSSLADLLQHVSQNVKGFRCISTAVLVAALEGVRNLKDLYGLRECRDFMVQHGLTQYATFWAKSLLPSYAWTIQSLWTDNNREAGVQSDTRTLVSDIKSNMEDLLIRFLPSKPYYHQLDDLKTDSWGRLVAAVVRTQVPIYLARELESFRRYLLETVNFPQPAVHVGEATRCLLLSGRMAHLGLSQLDTCGAIADSHMLEHACALRLTLAERPWNWDSTETDSCLFGLLKRAAHGLPWRWLQGVPSCSATIVLFRAPHIFSGQCMPPDMSPAERRVCGQIWRLLSHATVQCYLGWWLAASTMVLRPGGVISGFSLPDNLLVTCRACWQRRGEREEGELRGLQAPLYAAAVSWMYGMLTRQCRGSSAAVAGIAASGRTPPPPSLPPPAGSACRPTNTAAAAAAESATSVVTPTPTAGAAAVAYVSPAAVHETAAAAPSTPPLPVAPVPTTAAAAPTAAREPASTGGEDGSQLPYSAQNMHDIILPVSEHCVDFVAAVGSLGSLFADTLAAAALSLSLSLQFMAPDAAEARLRSCWQLLGRILAMDLGSARSRSVRDLAQAAGRVLRLQLPNHLGRPESATMAAGATALPAAPLRCKTWSSVGGTGCGSRGAAPSSRGTTGDGGGSCGDLHLEGGPSPSSNQSQEVETQQQWGWESLRQHPFPPPPPPPFPQLPQCQDPQRPPHHGHHVQHSRLLHSSPPFSPPHLSPHHNHPYLYQNHHPYQPHNNRRRGPPEHRYHSPSLVLRCALGSLFLPSLERTLRALLYAPGPGAGSSGSSDAAGPSIRLNAAYDLASACIAVDLALRRPGCWPALLAHGPPLQMASLILTMRKVAVAADEMELLLPQAGATAAAGTGVVTAGDPRVIWRLQLLALLEQCLPFTLTPGVAAAAVSGAAAAATAAAASAAAAVRGERSPRGRTSPLAFSVSQPSSLGAVHMAPVPDPPGPHLHVNHGLCGVRDPWGSCGGGGGGAAEADDDGDDLHAGPGWLEVLGFGACPAIGSPACSQQERMLVLAASSWLPLLLTALEEDGGAQGASEIHRARCKDLRLVPVHIAVLAVHGGHRVAWQWLLLLARQCLAAVGTAAHAGWMRLLRRVLVVDQITAVLRLYCAWVRRCQEVMTTDAAVILSASGGAAGVAVATSAPAAASAASGDQHTPISSTTGDGSENNAGIDPAFYDLHQAALRVVEVLPTVLDVLETLVAATPDAVALALADNRKARELISVAEDLRSGAAADGAGELPYPGAGSPAALAAQQRLRQRQQRREELRQAALPPAWGPGLPLDASVVSVLSMYGRHGLMRCLAELSTARGDRFSFRPQGLAAPTAPMPFSGVDGGNGWRTLPDPLVVRQQLGFSWCAYEGCTNLEGSSEATLLTRAYGSGRAHPAACYCRVSCQQADRQALAPASLEARGGSEMRLASRGTVNGLRS